MHKREKERNKYRASNFFFPGNVGKNSCTCFCQKIIHNLPKDEKKFHAPENSHPPPLPFQKLMVCPQRGVTQLNTRSPPNNETQTRFCRVWLNVLYLLCCFLLRLTPDDCLFRLFCFVSSVFFLHFGKLHSNCFHFNIKTKENTN